MRKMERARTSLGRLQWQFRRQSFDIDLEISLTEHFPCNLNSMAAAGVGCSAAGPVDMAALWTPRSLVADLLYAHTPFVIDDLCKQDRFPKTEDSNINRINICNPPVSWIGQNWYPEQGFTISNTAVYNDQFGLPQSLTAISPLDIYGIFAAAVSVYICVWNLELV